MVERIRLLLEARQLSPTQFADAIGIARPIVSHILSGRNKPSLEVVQRILAAMPDLSIAWLLNGTGPMLVAEATSAVSGGGPVLVPQPVEPAKVPEPASIIAPELVASAAAKPVKNRQPSLQSVSAPIGGAVTASRTIPKRFTSRKPASELGNKEVPPASSPSPADEPAPMLAPASPVAVEPASVVQPTPAAALLAGSDKPIRRIVIFYRDGSFADFQPE
ncbi:helix-turn-helix domain-containing protein [Hymenobacter convexus]|uniref:helix-turn-helix domain-containing protein n=1 Tax=Hymenobacter sp. CA1UV-4 TaxID=3063782 RepID=UPI0035108D8B